MVANLARGAAKQMSKMATGARRAVIGSGSADDSRAADAGAVTKGAPTKKAPAKKAPATKAAPAKKAAPTTTARVKKAPVKKATAKTAVPTTKATARKAPAAPAPAKRAARPSTPSSVPVREGETPWTSAQLKGVRAELENDIDDLRAELEHAHHDLVDLMRDSGDGAGDDQADAGAKTYEREQEISLANNAREMLDQSEHALERLAEGTYGICESCGNAIGKLRLQAAPRATLCMPCKIKQERR